MWMKRCRRELMVNRIQLNGAGLNARWERNKANHWLNMQKHLYRISGRLQYISMCSRKMHRLFMNECRLLWLDDISHFTFHFNFIATNICQPFVSMSDIIVYLFVCCWYMWCCWCRCCRVPFFYTHINASNGIPLMYKCLVVDNFCNQPVHCALFHFQFSFTFFVVVQSRAEKECTHHKWCPFRVRGFHFHCGAPIIPTEFLFIVECRVSVCVCDIHVWWACVYERVYAWNRFINKWMCILCVCIVDGHSMQWIKFRNEWMNGWNENRFLTSNFRLKSLECKPVRSNSIQYSDRFHMYRHAERCTILQTSESDEQKKMLLVF